MTNCRFENNSADFGGAVCGNLVVNVADCNFTGNRASEEGSALYMGSGNVVNSNFTNNTASNDDGIGDGGAIYINGNLTVINSTFTGNRADTVLQFTSGLLGIPNTPDPFPIQPSWTIRQTWIL